MNSGPRGGTRERGVRGPMDRYLVDNDRISSPQTMSPANAQEHQNQVCLSIGRFFFENGIPFSCVRSPSFIRMLRTVGNYGRGLKVPTMYELSTWILKEEEKNTSLEVEKIKETWKTTGVSLLSDGWSDVRNRRLINLFVNNQFGTVFLKTVDASDCVKNTQKLFELFDEAIEEIGEDIVVQVIMDDASAYKAAGKLLMQKRKSLYWTPCAAHCIDLMLEKIGQLPQHKDALRRAKLLLNFIDNHQCVLSLPSYKYLDNELLRPGATRFATAYLTIQRIHELKSQLQMMFVSQDWANCACATKDDDKAVKKIIMDEEVFWPTVEYAIKTTEPLIKVLRMVDGERTPTMGFIYGVMDEAKKYIAKNVNGDLPSYKEIWDIIDQKWENQLHRDLHATGYYLNPRYRWSSDASQHPEIKWGLYNCMDRLIKNQDIYTKIDAQFDDYKYKRGLLGIRASLGTYMTRTPVEWWDKFGDEVPELKKFATKILGLTCSASACERNRSTFNQVHMKKRNRLNTSTMNSLAYIMYNKKLMYKYMKNKSQKEDDDALIVDNMSFDDAWVANPIMENDEDGDSDGESSARSRKRKRNQALDKGKGKRIQIDVSEEDEEDEDRYNYQAKHLFDGDDDGGDDF